MRELSQRSWGHGREHNTTVGRSLRPKGGAIPPCPQEIPIVFHILALTSDFSQCSLFPSTIHCAHSAAIGFVGLPNTTPEVGRFHQQINIFILIYNTLQPFGKRITAQCTYQALCTARAQSREQHQHLSEHKWLIMWPNGKLNRSFTLSASTAEKSLATSPSATPFSSRATNSKPLPALRACSWQVFATNWASDLSNTAQCGGIYGFFREMLSSLQTLYTPHQITLWEDSWTPFI